jgi:hypothetical protein
MTAYFEYSHVIDRPVEKVFQFMARDHVRNHPRWDPDIELWLDDDAPLSVGTIIHRRNSRSGSPVEGTMKVVEFEPNRSFATLVHDGQVVINGSITFEDDGHGRTIVTTRFNLPGMDDTMDKTFMNSRLERSAQNQKRLIGAEIPKT